MDAVNSRDSKIHNNKKRDEGDKTVCVVFIRHKVKNATWHSSTLTSSTSNHGHDDNNFRAFIFIHCVYFIFIYVISFFRVDGVTTRFPFFLYMISSTILELFIPTWSLSHDKIVSRRSKKPTKNVDTAIFAYNVYMHSNRICCSCHHIHGFCWLFVVGIRTEFNMNRMLKSHAHATHCMLGVPYNSIKLRFKRINTLHHVCSSFRSHLKWMRFPYDAMHARCCCCFIGFVSFTAHTILSARTVCFLLGTL